MANYDIYRVTCTEKGVLEHIKNNGRYREILQDEEDTFSLEANASYGFLIIKDASRAYPDAILHLNIAQEADYYSENHILTMKNGEHTLDNVELSYIWNYNDKGDEDGSITKAAEDFFRKIDKVTMLGGGKYDADWNEDKGNNCNAPNK